MVRIRKEGHLEGNSSDRIEERPVWEEIMNKKFEGTKPIIDEKTYIADGAQIIGKVTIKEYSSIWFNTVVRLSLIHISKVFQ